MRSLHVPRASHARVGLWPALTLSALLVACGDDAVEPDASVPVDAGVADTGPADTGVRPDAGRDAGRPDVGRPDAGYYCVQDGGVETVEDELVPVPAATMTPRNASDLPAALGCIARAVTPDTQGRVICLTQCLDFLGFEPTQAQIDDLELDVFEQEVPGGGVVDPSFDYGTRRERSPGQLRDIRSTIRRTTNPTCRSGWQIEVGYPSFGGADGIATGQRYVFRSRSRSTRDGAWVPTYLWSFIRRLDEANEVPSSCAVDENRIPETNLTFPVVAVAKLRELVQATSASVPSATDLEDGRGVGHVLVEARDCSSFSGAPAAHFTVGLRPTAAGAAYLGVDGTATAGATATTVRAALFGLGVGVPTSTVASVARVAVGMNRDGACTEAFGGARFPVFPDAVTIVRINRETTLGVR